MPWIGYRQKPAHVEKGRAARAAARHARVVETPAWVPERWREEYAERARQSGEEAAAAHVRRLKAKALR